jgi:nitrous oxidase accessory protein NosD
MMLLATGMLIIAAVIIVWNVKEKGTEALDENTASKTISNVQTTAAVVGARGADMESFKKTVFNYTLAKCGSDCYNAKSKGIKSNGSNVLAPLQTLINNVSKKGGGVVYLPAGSYGIKGVLRIPKNIKLVGAGSSTVLRQLLKNSELIRIENTSNVLIASMTLDQTKVSHTSGQSNHGIFIAGASRVGLKGLLLKGPFQQNGKERGDGIYIRRNGDTGSIKSEIIVIKDSTVEGASRNGISMVSGENVWIENVQLRNFSGNINAALDFEPEAGDTVRKVTVNQVTINEDDLNLYTHKGKIEEVVLRGVKIPAGGFHLEGNVTGVLIESSSASHFAMLAADTDKGRPRSVVVKKSTFKNDSNTQTAYLAGESVTFDECEFIGGTTAAVRDAGTTNRITVKNSIVRDSNGDGMFIYKPKKIELSGNQIYRNKGNGVALGTSGSTVELITISGSNNIYENSKNGLRIDLPKADVYMTDTDVTGNGESGLFLSNCESALIGQNRFSNNNKGILISAYDKNRSIYNVVLKENTITNSKKTQVYGIQIVNGVGRLKGIQVLNNTIVDSLTENLLISPETSVPIIQVEGNQMK